MAFADQIFLLCPPFGQRHVKLYLDFAARGIALRVTDETHHIPISKVLDNHWPLFPSVALCHARSAYGRYGNIKIVHFFFA